MKYRLLTVQEGEFSQLDQAQNLHQENAKNFAVLKWTKKVALCETKMKDLYRKGAHLKKTNGPSVWKKKRIRKKSWMVPYLPKVYRTSENKQTKKKEKKRN